MASGCLQALFQGRYQKVIEQVRNKGGPAKATALALLGAQCFLGHLEEAQTLWRTYGDSFGPSERVQARFFLGVALTRISKFKKARRLFGENLRESKTGEDRAFAYQGAGFYSYFRGHFDRAAYWSQKSLRQAVKSRQAYVEYLAMDLLGHATVQAGQRSRGLRLIQEANRLALLQKNANFSAAFRDARLIYESEIGLRPQSMVQELNQAVANRDRDDSYTRGNLILELARQLTLRGQYEKAKAILNREASSIYALGNRRQEVNLQLRLAEIAAQQGDFHLMNHLLQSAKKTVALLADKAFEIKLLGLALKIPPEISGLSPEAERARLLALSGERSSLINRQILSRQDRAADPQTPAGEDPLHDLFLLARNDSKQAGEQALAQGYLGIYRQIGGFAAGQLFLQVFENGSGFVAGSREEIAYVPTALSRQQIRLLHELSRWGADKESLIQTVWGYKYDPLRHDALVHNAIGKLRKALGSYATWIITNESGWSWDPRVQLLLMESGAQARPVSLQKVEEFQVELNFRQRHALKTAPEISGWSVSAYKKAFKVATMTAFRDLTDLHQKGLVLRTGRGRACRYLLPKGAEREN